MTNMIHQLQELGLKENEAKVYLSLLKIGMTSVGAIIKDTKFHRMIVYGALDRLVEMGLVDWVYKNNRKHFEASNPEQFFVNLEQKQSVAESLVPQLQELQNIDDQIEVKILQGQKGFFDNMEQMVLSAMQHDGVQRIIGGGSGEQFYQILGNHYEKYLQFCQEKGVKKWLLSPEATSELFKQNFAKESGNVLKTLPDGLSSPVYTRITPSLVSIEVYAATPHVIQIHNKAVAQGYMESFELMWQVAKIYHSKKNTKKI